MYVRNHVRSICTCLNCVLYDHLALLFVNQGKKMIGWVWNGYNTETKEMLSPYSHSAKSKKPQQELTFPTLF